MLVLGPNDNQLQTNKSDMTDSRFNGKRQIKDPNSVPVSNDYTLNTPADSSLIKAQIEEITMDVDDIVDLSAGKDGFTRGDRLNNRDTTECSFITDLSVEDIEEFCEDSRSFVPEVSSVKTYGKKLMNYLGAGGYNITTSVGEVIAISADITLKAYISNAGAMSVSIPFGFITECSVMINWGDGTTDTYGSTPMSMITHTYSVTGEYTIKITGDLDTIWAFGIIYDDKLEFDWDISALTKIEWLFVQGCSDKAVLDLSKLKGITTLKAVGCSDNSVFGKLSDLPKSVSNIGLTNEPLVTGDLSDLSDHDFSTTDLLARSDIVGGSITLENTNITGDISDIIKENMKDIYVWSNANNFAYTSCQIPASFANSTIVLISCGMDVAETSQLILDIDAAIEGPANGRLEFGITNIDAVNEASNSLRSKGYIVTFMDT